MAEGVAPRGWSTAGPPACPPHQPASAACGPPRPPCSLSALHPQLVKASDVIFIAVKPQYVATVLRECKPNLTDRHVIVSIAAGVTLQTMKVRVLAHFTAGAIGKMGRGTWGETRPGLAAAWAR